MGNCMGANSGGDPALKKQIAHAQNLDKQISKKAANVHAKDQQVAKLLLLGAGESGKSTLFRQMIKLFGQGFHEQMRQGCKTSIYENVLDAVSFLVKENEERKDPEFELGPEAKKTAAMVLKGGLKKNAEVVFGAQQVAMVKTLWSDPAFKLTFEKRKTVQVPESTGYFFDRIDALAAADYLPDDEDMLRMRVRTLGMMSQKFQIDKLAFELHDVGGQRNERRKWIHSFDGVTAVLFVTAISEYDMVCFEDEQSNRMLESLDVFEQTFTTHFINTPIILFLNKKDLFDKKFFEIPLKDHFPDFKGSTLDEGYEFWREKFASRLHSKRDIYSHVTTATDSDNCKRVFLDVKDIVLRMSLRADGILE